MNVARGIKTFLPPFFLSLQKQAQTPLWVRTLITRSYTCWRPGLFCWSWSISTFIHKHPFTPEGSQSLSEIWIKTNVKVRMCKCWTILVLDIIGLYWSWLTVLKCWWFSMQKPKFIQNIKICSIVMHWSIWQIKWRWIVYIHCRKYAWFSWTRFTVH